MEKLSNSCQKSLGLNTRFISTIVLFLGACGSGEMAEQVGELPEAAVQQAAPQARAAAAQAPAAREEGTAVTSLSCGSGSVPQPGHVYKIEAKHSRKLLAVPGSTGSWGAQLVQWDNNNGSEQMWSVADVGSGNIALFAKHDGLAMACAQAGIYNGERVIQWGYNGGAEQQIQLVDVGDSYYQLKFRHSGRLVAVSGAGKANGTSIIQWDDTGGDEQKFRFLDVNCN